MPQYQSRASSISLTGTKTVPICGETGFTAILWNAGRNSNCNAPDWPSPEAPPGPEFSYPELSISNAGKRTIKEQPLKRRSVMCYSSRADFGWDTRKDTVRKPEAHREPAKPEAAPGNTLPVDHPEPRSHADETRLWAFLARRKEPRRRQAHAPGPVQDRIGEKV